MISLPQPHLPRIIVLLIAVAMAFSLSGDSAALDRGDVDSVSQTEEGRSQRNMLNDEYTITVVAPAERDAWEKGTTHTIRWRAPVAVRTVDIHLWHQIVCITAPCPQRPSTLFTIANAVPNTGRYEWQVPSLLQEIGLPPSGSYAVRVVDARTGVFGDSGFFGIFGGPPADEPPPSAERVPGFPGCVGPACNEGGIGGDVVTLNSLDPAELEAALQGARDRYIVARVSGIVDVPDPGIIVEGLERVTLDLRESGYHLTGRGLWISGRDVVVLGPVCHGIRPLATHEERRNTVGDCVGFRACENCVIAYGESYGTVDEAFDAESTGRPPGNRNVGIMYNRMLPGCGNARGFGDCQAGRGHNRASNATGAADDVYWYQNAMVGFNWRIPRVRRARGAVSHNLIAYRGERSTTADADGRADVVGNVYWEGPESQGPQLTSQDGGSVFVADNWTCHGAHCSPGVELSRTLTPLPRPAWPGLRLPSVDPASLRSWTWYAETIGPGYVTPLAQAVWDRLRNGTLVVGDGYNPARFVPEPYFVHHGSDTDGDGIPDASDSKPRTFSAWDDTNNDGWPDLVAYQSRVLNR